ncbi:hypothetical protein E6W36_12095 [Hankyongella ginsenosidimutans]|uniref:Uncharacterized protein n=1 Tax=Hankyongella ginsenosidimutans TaxID=1763828 RepID=A0A4D7CBQ0_9SPHN|nr:BrnA antitoxin family protein [Hankyongella ginsenosidimutans]QCI79986.1 hypothetical protein E6W36_12095 [Hankyongella ginsenosidimutans]TXG83317.1 MAG: hypothetical protein E6R12_08570 [Sphingomonadales bacterium]
MPKALPKLGTDAEAEVFVETADLTGYDLSGLTAVKFELAPKAARLNMRLPTLLLDAVKAEAAREGMPYQRFIRLALERAITR